MSQYIESDYRLHRASLVRRHGDPGPGLEPSTVPVALELGISFVRPRGHIPCCDCLTRWVRSLTNRRGAIVEGDEYRQTVADTPLSTILRSALGRPNGRLFCFKEKTMKSTTAQEVGRTVRLALNGWGYTLRLVALLIVVGWLVIAMRRLPLITW